MSNYNWDLTHLYPALDSVEYKTDINETFALLADFLQWCDVAFANVENAPVTIADYFKKQNETFSRVSKIVAYPELIASVETQNTEAEATSSTLYSRLSDYYAIAVKFAKYLETITDIDSVLSEVKPEYRVLCEEIIRNNSYLLSEDEEVLIAKLRTAGSEAWQTLYAKTTSALTFTITEDGQENAYPLAMASRFLQSEDAQLRKQTYHAVSDARESVKDVLAQALRAIKMESIITNQRRGYDSIIQEVALSSRMSEQSLDALWSAVENNAQLVNRFFKAKAKKLGTDKLKPYDLQAPLGKSESKYSVADAQKIILECFGAFSDNKQLTAQRAFDENWIDYFPRENKRAGAFCYSIQRENISYIMSNYNENIGDIVTLAHELGHAYHGQALSKSEYVLSRYTLPLAETASNFAERLVKDRLLTQATAEEKLQILDNALIDFSISTLVIYIRFLFEKTIIERYQAGEILEPAELTRIELELYDRFLSESFDNAENRGVNWIAILHHFYHDYYNFPYAFGLLYASGLYAQYKKFPNDFVQHYDDMLILTGYENAQHVAASLNVNIETIDFWNESMQSFTEMVELYEAL